VAKVTVWGGLGSGEDHILSKFFQKRLPNQASQQTLMESVVHLTIQPLILMKNLLTYFLVAFTALQSYQTQAQLVWQHLDTIGGIKRGNFILPSPTGVYVITDEPTLSNALSYGGQTNVFHRSNAGVLDWTRKIDLGNSGFANYGFLLSN
jgi:hypothetical protein